MYFQGNRFGEMGRKNYKQMIIQKPLAPIPVSIIGGFLGSGKTTLLNDILTGDHGVRAGVLVNDFGAINIDSKLVVGVDDNETISLENGCICCDIRDDLVAACLMMLQRPEPPEVLLIETSGVSDPFQVANSFVNPDFNGAFLLNTILTVVDAEQLPNLKGEMASLAIKQIEVADFLVLNKIDLVSNEGLKTVKGIVRKIAPNSRILETTYGNIPLELVFSNLNHKSEPLKLKSEHSHEHHTDRHAFSTWHWTSDQKISLPSLKLVLDNLPGTIFRAKGIVYLEEMPTYKVVMQMVGGRYEIGETDKWKFDKPKTEIVLIGTRSGFDTELLQEKFDACIGTGDDSHSPVLRLVKKIAPHLLEEQTI